MVGLWTCLRGDAWVKETIALAVPPLGDYFSSKTLPFKYRPIRLNRPSPHCPVLTPCSLFLCM
jgi:hypothetical protein